jgi:hypothetical protein
MLNGLVIAVLTTGIIAVGEIRRQAPTKRRRTFPDD